MTEWIIQLYWVTMALVLVLIGGIILIMQIKEYLDSKYDKDFRDFITTLQQEREKDLK